MLAFWSNFEADKHGFDIYQNHNGGFLACTNTIESQGSYFVGEVQDLVEHINPPTNGFQHEDFITLSEKYWINIPPMRLQPPKIKKKILIDVEL